MRCKGKDKPHDADPIISFSLILSPCLLLTPLCLSLHSTNAALSLLSLAALSLLSLAALSLLSRCSLAALSLLFRCSLAALSLALRLPKQEGCRFVPLDDVFPSSPSLFFPLSHDPASSPPHVYFLVNTRG